MADDTDCVATLKILVVGDSGTGKSSLLVRFIDDLFDPDQGPTIGPLSWCHCPPHSNTHHDRDTRPFAGVDFKAKVLDVHGNKTKLTIWVT